MVIRIYFTDREIWDRVVNPRNYAKRVNAIARNIKRKKKYDKCTVDKIQYLGR